MIEQIQFTTNALVLVLGLMFTILGSNIQSRVLGVLMVILGCMNFLANMGVIG